MQVLALVSLAWIACSSSAPPPKAPSPGDWTTIAHGTAISVAVERALYERQGAPSFFVRVRVTNAGSTDVRVDLRKYHEVFYPNQWGASASDHREVIDERRMVLPPFDPAALIADFPSSVLTKIPAGQSLDYFEAFNASSKAEVDAQSKSTAWVIVTMDGQLKITDGAHAERLVSDDNERDVAIRAPVEWKTIPPGAVLISD